MRKPRLQAGATASEAAVAPSVAAPPPSPFPASSSGVVEQDVTLAVRGVLLSLREGQRIEGIDEALRRFLNASGALIAWDDADVR